MSDYLLLVQEDEKAHADQPPAETARRIEARAAFTASLRAGGKLRDAARLRPSAEGKRLRAAGDEVHVASGPFEEQGLALGEYYWVIADDLADAARLACGHPGLPSDRVDVRPVMQGHVADAKDDKPGKVFACGVLGSAVTEAGWVEVMDRIDAETRGRFPAPSFLGGVRLHPPSAGKLLVSQGERRATLDGPFLESKEVIGGVFLIRMATLDDAVRWARQTRFVVHGTLEIRELWRT